jgi:hypothetical protein
VIHILSPNLQPRLEAGEVARKENDGCKSGWLGEISASILEKQGETLRALAPAIDKAIAFALWLHKDIQEAKRKLAFYWRERGRIEAELEKIRKHDLVRCFDYDEALVFFDPDDVDCPHGRRRKRCERIHALLERLRRDKGPRYEYPRGRGRKRVYMIPSRRALRPRGVELEKIDAELKRYRIDPTSEPNDFCDPLRRAFELPALEALAAKKRAGKHAGGRPKGSIAPQREYLLGALLGIEEPDVAPEVRESQERMLGMPPEAPEERRKGLLRDNGLTKAEALEVVSVILRECFAERVDAEALKRQWRRLRRADKNPGRLF